MATYQVRAFNFAIFGDGVKVYYTPNGAADIVITAVFTI